MTSATIMDEWDILKERLRIFAENEYLRSQGETFSEIIDEITMEVLRRLSENQDTAVKAKKIPAQLHTSLKLLLGQIIQDEKELEKLRFKAIQRRKKVIEHAKWSIHIRNQGPWSRLTDPVSLDGAPSQPNSVTISDQKSLEPFFEHIYLGGTHEENTAWAIVSAEIKVEPYYQISTLEFEKGILCSDGRMDLCNMALGPANIGTLLESLRFNDFIKHVLLGNNMIGPEGAHHIAEYLKEYPNKIDTWYLAENCISGFSFKLLVNGWVESNEVTNIWLKKNPLGPGAAKDLFRLITETPNLRTLDLDQSELGDVGVARLFSGLASYTGRMIPLKHVYLNATGVSSLGAEAIGNFLASPYCNLDSLYLSNNPMGDDGIRKLALGLQKNKLLSRLILSSVGMTGIGAIALCEALKDHPTLFTLDVGQSYATPDLGMRFNWITDDAAYAISKLAPKLLYLNLGYSALTHNGMNQVLQAVTTSDRILYYAAETVHLQSSDASALEVQQQHASLQVRAQSILDHNIKYGYSNCDVTYDEILATKKRWLVNDECDVGKIDSVYRNRDVELARRGLEELDSFWDGYDETLAEVMSTFEHVSD